MCVRCLEYEQLDVASDSEDDKRIRSAEDRAKARADKSTASDNFGNLHNGFQSNFRSFRRGTGSFGMGVRYSDQQQQQQHQQYYGRVVCYRCGVLGHTSSQCGQVGRTGPMGMVSAGATSIISATNDK